MSDAQSSGPVSRKLLIILGVVAASAVLFVFVISPLLSGGDDGGDVELGGEVGIPSEAASPASPDGEAEPDSDAVDDTGQPPAATFEVFSARDPFQQLVSDDGGGAAASTGGDATSAGSVAPTAGGAVASTSSDTGSGVTTSVGSGATGTGTAGVTGGSATGSTGKAGSADAPEEANLDGTTVTLVDVYEDGDGRPAATVTVNGTGYTIGEGDTFAEERLRLLDVSDRCATLLFRDSRFTLCEGEAIRK